MRQFDVYVSPSEATRRIAPFVVVLQSHFLDDLPTVVVAPMLRQSERPAYEHVSIEIDFGGERLVVSPAEMIAIDRRQLKGRKGNLGEHEDLIRRAIERLFTGF